MDRALQWWLQVPHSGLVQAWDSGVRAHPLAFRGQSRWHCSTGPAPLPWSWFSPSLLQGFYPGRLQRNTEFPRPPLLPLTWRSASLLYSTSRVPHGEDLPVSTIWRTATVLWLFNFTSGLCSCFHFLSLSVLLLNLPVVGRNPAPLGMLSLFFDAIYQACCPWHKLLLLSHFSSPQCSEFSLSFLYLPSPLASRSLQKQLQGMFPCTPLPD